jgi:hypothetical protein
MPGDKPTRAAAAAERSPAGASPRHPRLPGRDPAGAAQRAAGNLAVGRLLASYGIQAKLTVSQPGDPEEEEADRVADAVVSRAVAPTIQRKCAACESGGAPCAECEKEEPVQRKQAAAFASLSASAMARAISAVSTGGAPLPVQTRNSLEPGFGRDLSRVRVHADSGAGSAAHAIGARAFTVGHHIAFAPGEYQPGNREGQRLLAHEVAHTIQRESPPRVRREPVATPTPAAPAIDVGGVKQSVEIIMKALRGVTTAGDSTDILNQFRKKDTGTVAAIMEGIKAEGSKEGKSRDEMVDWLFGDMTAEDSRDLRKLLIEVGVIDDVGRIVAALVKKQLEKWFTSGEEVINAVMQFGGTSLDTVLGMIQTATGRAPEALALKLFGDLDRVSAEKLRQHFFDKGGPASLAYASTWTAFKINELLEGYVSHADSSQVVWNFETTPKVYRPVVEQRLDILTTNSFGLSAGDALMKFLDESDYKTLAGKPGLILEPWQDKRDWKRKTVAVLEWGEVFLEWTTCGVIGIATGLLSAIWDILKGFWDIGVGVYHLIWSLLYLLSGGSVGSENWLAVKDFFRGLKELGSPGKVWDAYWDGLKTEFATIEGPLSNCRVAELAVRKFIVAVVNIVLIFVAGYGLVKAGVKAVQTIAELAAIAREFGLLEAIIQAGIKIGGGVRRLVIVTAEEATKLAKMLLNPLETLINAGREINLILLAMREEGVYAFLRGQGAELTAAEKDFWNKQKELWRTRAERIREQHVKTSDDAEGFKGLLDEEKRAPAEPESEIDRINEDSKKVAGDAQALNDEVVGQNRPSPATLVEVEKEVPLLEEELRKPGGARLVTDPDFVDAYDVEAKVGEHTYRRRADGTWCRFTKVDCGLKMGNANAEADKALAAKKPPTVHEWPPKKLPWPPEPPVGDPPPFTDPGSATWRYERYRHTAYLEGRMPAKDPLNALENEILPPDQWKKRYFDVVLEGGRPGRGGSPAHAKDVLANNFENKLEPKPLSNGRVPDGVGQPRQKVVIRGQTIDPGEGRVLVESDHLVYDGTMPNSEARDQVRAFRRADPDATIVVTDLADPARPPLVYPPGKQPPPPGPLPKGQAPIVNFP